MTVLYPVAYLGGKRVHVAEVQSSLTLPWRIARVRTLRLPPVVNLQFGHEQGRIETVFSTLLIPEDDVSGDWRGKSDNAMVRGLPHWRKEIPAQGFQDATLEAVLGWIAGTCGGQLDLNVKGKALRHYQVRQGPAHRAVREALAAWRAEAVLLELDSGALHIGPEDRTPHALVKDQARLVMGRNILSLSDVGNGRFRLSVPGMCWLRVCHRVEIKHDLFKGRARITEVNHRWGGKSVTDLEVVKL